MRWSCPHCGVNLGVSDDKLGTGWSFSRCYKCGGHALVRRSEVNLVKVDRAPAGEQVILPEGSDEPLLSGEVTQRLSRYIRRTDAAATAQLRAKAQTPASVHPHLPEPLPELGESTTPIPQDLEEAEDYPVQEARPAAANSAIAGDRRILSRIQNLIGKHGLPMGIGAAGLLAVSSGTYLVVQGQSILAHASRSTAASPVAVMNDQVRQRSMAPSREEPTQGIANPSVDPAPAVAPAPKVATAVAQTQSQTPAMQLADNTENTRPGTFVVQVKPAGADIHAGPGALYSRIGTASPQARYVVADWSDRWFKVLLPATGGAAAERSGWIRTDLVQMVRPRSDENLPDSP